MNNNYWIILADTQLGAIHWQHSIREQDYYEAFQTQCLNAASDKNCLGILGLGDLRERASIQARNLGGLNRGLKILAQADKCLLALMGNHDKTSPNWIKEMCYPSLKDLCEPKVQEKFGFDPKTTLASHFLPKAEIRNLIKQEAKGKNLIFLHQSLKELTTHLLQSYDLSVEDFTEQGLGQESPCEVFMGDLHNYGDIKHNLLSIAYPGSPEMTDINEGINGLKSQVILSQPHDYRKFVIHFYPEREENRWEPVEIKPRPWFRGKAKNQKESDKLLEIISSHSTTWETQPCVLLTLPKEQIETFKDKLKTVDCLELRIQEYDPYIDDELNDGVLEEYSHSLSWLENKKKLQDIATTTLDQDSALLLAQICASDGSNHSTKADIAQAWDGWKKHLEQQNIQGLHTN